MDSAYLSSFFIWGAIAVCVSQSAIFSGMNLAVFSSRGDIIDRDSVLIWGDKEKRVITGADILGRLLHGI